MTSANKTSQVLWVSISKFTTLFFTMLVAAVLSRLLSKQDYGTYRQVLYVYNTLLVVFAVGVPKAYGYFLPQVSDEEAKTLLKKINLILFLLGLAFSTFLFFGATYIGEILRNQALGPALKIFAPIPLLLLPTIGIDSIFVNMNKTRLLVLFRMISHSIMACCIILPVLIMGHDHRSALIGWLVSAFVTCILALVFSRIPYRKIAAKETTFSNEDIFKYCLPLMVAALYGVGIKAANQFFVSRYFGTVEFATFANGFIPLPFVGMIINAVSAVLFVSFSETLNRKEVDWQSFLSTWQNALKKSAKIIYPLTAFAFAFAPQIMVILYGVKYLESSLYFRIHLVLNFFNVIAFAPLILATGETRYYARVHLVFMVVIWSTHYLLLYVNSPIVIAMNSIFISILIVFVFLRFLVKKFALKFADLVPLQFLLKNLIISITSALLAYGIIATFASAENPLLFLLAGGMLWMIALYFIAYIFGEDYRELLKPLMKKII